MHCIVGISKEASRRKLWLEKHSFDVYVALPLRNGVSICFVRKALLTVLAYGSE
jgi:hypothetical protein